MSGFQCYDQWKTASPHDDEPDVGAECEKLAVEVQACINARAELSDLTHSERILLEQCRDTLNAAAEWISEH